MSDAAEISGLRKAGRLGEALELARGAYDAAPHDIYIQRAYGWVLHAIFKKEVEDFEQQRVSQAQFADRFGGWIAEYQVFGANERPNLLYSQMLNQAVKGSRGWPGLVAFARWWDPQYLMAEDHAPFTLPNGKQAPSLAMRLHYALGRELCSPSRNGDAELLQWAEAQLGAALQAHPDDPWLNYYRSKCLLDQGDAAEARQCLLPVVRRQRKAAWVWTLLGQTFEASHPGSAVTCYFRAIQLAGKPMEVANTRISLAELLAQQQQFDAAAVQVHHALGFRLENGFKVPQALQQLAGSSWFRQRPDRTVLPAEPDVSAEADAILRSLDARPLVYRLGVVDNQNPQKSLAHAAFSMDEGTVLHHDRFEGADRLVPGQIIEVGHADGDKRPRHFRPSPSTAIDGFCKRISGELRRREGQAFAFLVSALGEQVFVPPDLVEGSDAGEPADRTLACVACLSRDKRGKTGWRALRWVA